MIFSDQATAVHAHRAAVGRITIIFGCSRCRSTVGRSATRRPVLSPAKSMARMTRTRGTERVRLVRRLGRVGRPLWWPLHQTADLVACSSARRVHGDAALALNAPTIQLWLMSFFDAGIHFFNRQPERPKPASRCI